MAFAVVSKTSLMPVSIHNRRHFIEKGFIMAATAGIGTTLLNSCKDKKTEEGQESISAGGPDAGAWPSNRVLLIYDTCRIHLVNKESFQGEAFVRCCGGHSPVL